MNLTKSNFSLIVFIILGYRAAATLVQGEPKQPNIKTDVPGPNSKKLLEELNSINVTVYITIRHKISHLYILAKWLHTVIR